MHLTGKFIKTCRRKTVHWKRFLKKLLTLTDKFFNNDKSKTVYWKQFLTDPNPKLCLIYIFLVSISCYECSILAYKIETFCFNPFVSNAPSPYPLKTPGNLTIFLCFHGVERECIGNEWVKGCFSIINTKTILPWPYWLYANRKNWMFCYI